MEKEEIARRAVAALKSLYPDPVCALLYEKPYELLIAVRLSAQCTDARVNQVTPALFAAYPTLDFFAAATPEEIEPYIHSCGFFRAKAKSIVEMARQLRDNFHGRVPDTMEDLLTLSGVGRKSANLILGDIYHQPAIVADTHFIRIMGRLGLTTSKNPVIVERDLRPLIPPEESAAFCHRVVQFGRDICRARAPQCNICPCRDFCPAAKETPICKIAQNA